MNGGNFHAFFTLEANTIICFSQSSLTIQIREVGSIRKSQPVPEEGICPGHDNRLKIQQTMRSADQIGHWTGGGAHEKSLQHLTLRRRGWSLCGDTIEYKGTVRKGERDVT